MRAVAYGLLLCVASNSFASDALQRLKARYRAIEQGQTELPSLTQPPATALNVADTPEVSTVGIIPTGEELIFSVQLEEYALGDVLGVKTDAGAAFSLLDIASALDFPLSVGEAPVLAQGWIRSPDTPFVLRQQGQNFSVTVGDDTTTIDDGTLIDIDELYVTSAALERWFDISMALDFQTLTLSVDSEDPLPLQEKIARQQRADNISPLSNIAQHPLDSATYSPLSKPVVDLQASTTYTETGGSNSNLSILGSNDLAYFNTRYYANSNSELGLTDATLQASRISPEANLLGPLNASIIEFGDIRPTRVNSNAPTRDSVGLRISNERFGRQADSTVDLTGEIQPGWDIEIYRNNLLIDSQTNIGGGEYRFDNVPLTFGANTIELVFYGPQGQVERQTQSYYIDGTGQKAGDFEYDVSVFEDNTKLFEDNFNSQRLRQSYGTTVSGFARYALSDWFSVNAGQTQHLDDQYEAFDRQAFGTSTSLFGNALFTTDYVLFPDDSTLTEYALSTRLFDQAVRYSLNQADTWNEQNQQTQERELEELSVSGMVRDLNLSYQQDIRRLEVDGDESFNYRNQLATGVGSYYVSHQFDWYTDDRPNVGQIQLQRYLDNYFARLGFSYRTDPDWSANGIFAEVSGSPYPDVQTRVTLSRNIYDNINSIGLTNSWRPNEFTLTSNIAYNDILGWSTRLSGQVSIGQTDSSLFVSNRSLVGQGSVAVLVYWDRNDNGVFDASDEPLPNIKVTSRQSFRKTTSNDQGIALLKALPNYQQTDIEIDPNSVDDPFLMPRSAGLSVIPRSGTVQQVELPMVTSYEVEGTLHELSSDKPARTLSYAPVQLIDANGKIVDEVMTEFDGYYLFAPVPPRRYQVRVAPEYIQNRGYLAQTGRNINLDGRDDNIVAGLDLYLRKALDRQGYSAQIKTFQSLNTLRSYWSILKARHPVLAEQRYYHVRSEQGYTLYIGFTDSPDAIEPICDALAKLSCEVTQMARR
ncbi:hypothetical protein [Marinomonas ostreistagni]|uniref:hypothetical protein n=1 Tax=Marinomonas ostreistagni TaxID=359209 RepID=UPI00194FCCD3|nr:hypothetical protein [Marinomonas ostreistagni]MBM6549634.1 hypothetical protein [Marinomonas ostreistagni]